MARKCCHPWKSVVHRACQPFSVKRYAIRGRDKSILSSGLLISPVKISNSRPVAIMAIATATYLDTRYLSSCYYQLTQWVLIGRILLIYYGLHCDKVLCSQTKLSISVCKKKIRISSSKESSLLEGSSAMNCVAVAVASALVWKTRYLNFDFG